jgi:hypothetical protein
MKLTFQQFSGIAPRIAPRLLPATLAQEALDVKLWSGELRPHYADTIIKYIPSTTQSIYRYKWKNKKYNWLGWAKSVNVVKGPVYDDENNRIYLMVNDGTGFLVTDSSLLEDRDYINGLESKAYAVAIPEPGQSDIWVSGGTGSGDIESRSYVYCYVRQWSDGTIDVGKSSGPLKNSSDRSRYTVDVRPGQVVDMSIVDPIAHANGIGAGINKIYIYRSEVTSAGQALYSYVDQFDVNTNRVTNNPAAVWVSNGSYYKYSDSKPNTSLGEACPSIYWDPPVGGLKGLVSLQNGLFAAYKDSTIYVSDWNAPHAWPYEHTVTIDYPIVGLGSFGNTIVVCTEAAPVLITVTDPTKPTTRAIQENCPCVSAGSIVSTRNGVIFASTNGLVLINSASPTFITEKIITQDEWLPLHPESLQAAFLNNTYYGFFTNPTEKAAGFLFDLDSYTYSTVYNSIVSSGMVYTSQPTKLVYNDVEQSQLYVCYPLENKTQYSLNSFGTDSRINKSFRWRSKVNVSPQGLFTLSCAQVNFTKLSSLKPEPPVWEGRLAGSALGMVYVNKQPVNGWCKTNTIELYDKTVFNYYVDGKLRFTKNIVDSKPFRLPSGFRGETVEIELKSNSHVHSVILASSMGELVEGEQK